VGGSIRIPSDALTERKGSNVNPTDLARERWRPFRQAQEGDREGR
jgi:hypothetical protein